MMMLGEKIDAQTAVNWGLAYRMFEDGELLPTARAMATGLASCPTLAYGKIKRMLRAGMVNTFAQQLEVEAADQVGNRFRHPTAGKGLRPSSRSAIRPSRDDSIERF